MNYKKGPSIINTIPENHAVSVPVDIEIRIEFDMDISKSSIGGNVHLYDRLGNVVDSKIIYKNKVISIIPSQHLHGSHTYKVVVQGNNDPTSASTRGISNPLGYSMLGDYEFTISTYSQNLALENIINGSPNDIVINEQPTLKFNITEVTDNPVETIQVQISTTNTFNQISWEGTVDYKTIKDEGIKPNKAFEDGLYYWRARVIGETEGNWSDTFKFNVCITDAASIVIDDVVDVDIAFPEQWNMLEPQIIEVYPNDNFSNVSTNLKVITVVIDQIIPAESIKPEMFSFVGNSVDGDDTNTSHGEVTGILESISNEDEGTTTLTFTLPILGGEG